jgi:hypothetical protein
MIQERQAMVRIARRVMIAVGFATVFSTARSLAQASRLGLSPPDLVRSIENYDDRPQYRCAQWRAAIPDNIVRGQSSCNVINGAEDAVFGDGWTRLHEL